MLGELEALRQERERLRAELASRPGLDDALRLEQLDEQVESLKTERIQRQRKLEELEERVAQTELVSRKNETLREQNAMLESNCEVLRQAATELRAEVESLISHADAKTAFPACIAMDSDPELQSRVPMDDAVLDLAEFVQELQHRVAWDPDDREHRLYYSLEDLRSFVAGLAMSRLVLLQGISGTGKTSLPIAFARAVGTTAAVIPVQAGWRDPQDLVGHYNAFEKRFYESTFLQALYRAQTTRWSDGIHMIVLDEMNLSHPEQYFSDMLSALEQRPEQRRITIISHALDPAPDLLRNGRELPIPSNVWFIGTANHDETTKGFADKTYDRSHVMEFPEQPTPFNVNRPEQRRPLSCTALERAFSAAVKRHAGSAEQVIEFMRRHVHETLARDFRIGWGPRLERQLRRYVPVVIASGGTVGEAADHVLAMRLLRKLKNRHDNRPSHLQALKRTIQDTWTKLDQHTLPARSLRLLDDELREFDDTPEDAP